MFAYFLLRKSNTVTLSISSKPYVVHRICAHFRYVYATFAVGVVVFRFSFFIISVLEERVQTISFIEIRSLKISSEDWKTPEKNIRIESVLEKCKGHFFKTLNVMIFDRQVRRILVIRKICSFICHSRKRSRRSLWRRMKMVCDCGINIKDFPFVFPRDSCRFTRFRRKF